MGSREYSTSGLPVALLLALALPLAGCDPLADDDRSSGQDAPAALAQPSFLGQSRMVDPGRLSVTAEVNDILTVTEQRDGTWFTSFTLADDNTQQNTLIVTWFYRIPESPEPIVIARSLPTTISLSLQTREITVASYDRDFDFDGDGIDNLVEIESGTPPGVAGNDPGSDPGSSAVFEPGDGQGDCRLTRFPDDSVDADQDATRDRIALRDEPFMNTLAPDLGADRHVYFATFLVEVAGTLEIAHEAGLPVNTNAILYDRSPDAASDEGTSLTNVAANSSGTSDGRRASLTATLTRPGLYCYALFDEEADPLASGTPLSDVSIRIEFAPGT